jgi:RNA-directed DNA polymerase
MGKRSAVGELFLGNMGSIQRETRPSIQREDQLTMETKLEQIAAKARCEPKLRFTSLAHHITRDRVRKNLLQIPKWSAAGVDGQTVEAAKESFNGWIEPMLQSIHRQGYSAPDIRRVYIPKPGKTEKRPLGVPTVVDRALQRSTAEVLSAIYEQDFLPCSFGGRPKLSAHHALATLNEVIAGGKISWVLEADLKNFLDVASYYTFSFFERVEEVRSNCRYLNSYAFCPSAIDVNGLKLAALYTLQDGLPRDAE